MASSIPALRAAVRPLLPLLLVLGLVAACTAEEAQDAPESEDFSRADVAFLQGMIPHHEQALEMAELVPDRTEREELVGLAEDIAEQQAAELDEMELLLEESGAPPPDADAAAGDAHDDMGGMLTEDELTDLRGLDGTPFELTFLDRMISHHRGAVADAQEAVDRAQHPEVLALAERIVAEQEAEIEQMQLWRGEWEAEDG